MEISIVAENTALINNKKIQIGNICFFVIAILINSYSDKIGSKS